MFNLVYQILVTLLPALLLTAIILYISQRLQNGDSDGILRFLPQTSQKPQKRNSNIVNSANNYHSSNARKQHSPKSKKTSSLTNSPCVIASKTSNRPSSACSDHLINISNQSMIISESLVESVINDHVSAVESINNQHVSAVQH